MSKTQSDVAKDSASFLEDSQSMGDAQHRQAKSWRRKILPLLVLGLCVYAANVIMSSNPPASKGVLSKANPLQVSVKKVRLEDFVLEFDSFGRVKANNEIELFPLVSGRVNKTFNAFQPGAFFKQGDKLVQLDSSDYEVELEVAKSELSNAELALAEEEARYQQAQSDWSQQKKLKPSATASDYALRKPQLNAAQSKLAAAKARHRLASLNLQRTTITAPFDGRVAETFVGQGSVVGNSTRLARLHDTSSLEVRLPINNADLPFLNLKEIDQGNSMTRVYFENTLVSPVEPWEGEILRSDAAVELGSQQLYLIASLLDIDKISDDKRQNLKIGQYLKAKIEGGVLRDVIVIPNSSIYQGAYVYIVIDNEGAKTLQRQPVSVLWRNESVSVINAGLREGNDLVLTPLGQVTSGTLVTVTSDQPDKQENVTINNSQAQQRKEARL